MIKTLRVFIPVCALAAGGSVLPAQIDEAAEILRGDQVEWVRQYVSGHSPAFDAPYAIAVDSFGNVLVTGGSYGANQLFDIATIKYDSRGDTLWVRRYDGPGNSWDQGLAIAVDTSGNVYVTGRTFSEHTYFDYVTIKYDASGGEQWIAYYDGPFNNDDSAIAIAVDPSSNVYVSGYSSGSGTFYDYATIKYDSLGREQWVERYNGPGNTKDLASALALDASGNVYVTGSSGEGSTNLSDYITVKYDPSGEQQWVARYSNLYDYANAIAVDVSGNVFVTGRSFAAGTGYDYATVKYDTTGARMWVARYHNPGGFDDVAYAVKVDGSGSVFVTGESEGFGTSVDYATIKYSASGVEQWIRRYNGPGSAVDRAVALALDQSGNVYVTGESEGSSTVTDFATIKYDNLGDPLWIRRYSGTGNAGNTFDLATAMAVDATGGVYVTGRAARTGMSLYTTVKLRR